MKNTGSSILDDPDSRTQFRRKLYVDVLSGYLAGVCLIAQLLLLPVKLQILIHAMIVVHEVHKRRKNGKPLWLEILLLGYLYQIVYTQQPPSYLPRVLVHVADKAHEIFGVYLDQKIPDTVGYWQAAWLVELDLLVEIVILTLLHYSFRLGVVFVLLLPVLAILVSVFATQIWTTFLKLPLCLQLSVRWLMLNCWKLFTLELRMIPGIYRLLSKIEQKQLLKEHEKLRKKPSYKYESITTKFAGTTEDILKETIRQLLGIERPKLFRVLVLERRRLFQVPACRLEVVSLGDEPAHIAISYVWGNSELRKSIKIQDSRLDITDSAYEVIQHQQSFFTERRIWIDAICINQNDMDEKAQQIQWMREIYGHALRVDAYLATGYEDAQVWLLLIELRLKNWMSRTYGIHESAVFSKPHLQALWEGFADMLNSPWFNRIWTLQEATLARNLHLIHGMTRVSWPMFQDAVQAMNTVLMPALFSLKQASTSGEFKTDMHEKPITLGFVKAYFEHERNLILTHLLTFSRGRRSSDPRDLIYGLLGLTDPSVFKTIPIDYQISLQTLLTRTMRWTLYEEGMQCLIGCGDNDSDLRPPNLPSWVVDWSNPGIAWGRETTRNWKATVDVSDPFKGIVPSLNLTSDHLLVRFMVCDEKVGESLEKRAGTKDFKLARNNSATVHQHNWLSNALAIILRGTAPEHIETRKRMFYRTLTCDFEDPEEKEVLHWDNPKFKSDYELLEFWFNIGADANDAMPIKLEQTYRKAYEKQFSKGFPDKDTSSYLAGLFEHVLLNPDDFEYPYTLSELADKQERITKILFRLRFANQRRIGVTDQGRVSSFPRYAEVGDEICLIAGAPAPFVVRRHESIDGIETRSIIGWCYLHGGMDGSLATGRWRPCYLI